MSHATEFEMELRCPDCASPEVAMIDCGTRLECGNCGAEFVREEAFVSVADADASAAEADLRTGAEARERKAGSEISLFRFDSDRARRAINDGDGAIWPVNSFSDADELNNLFEAALEAQVIARGEAGAYIHVYPLSLSEPDPVLAVSRVGGPTLLGSSLKLRDWDGETPLEFTLRLLEEIAAEANALVGELEASR
jgi:hypothetical protein